MKTLTLAALLCFAIAVPFAQAQLVGVYDRDWQLRYYQKDEQFYDKDWRLIYYLKEGRIYDKEWNFKYYLKDGQIFDQNWHLRYYLKNLEMAEPQKK